jgi:hypothetical protein
METNATTDRSTTFRIGWLILLILSGLAAINHIVLTFVLDEPVLFIGWAAYNLYAIAVLYFPFRRGERWAWFTSWLLVIGFASLILFDAEVGPFYLGAAVLFTIGLLLTRSAFFQQG